MAVVLMCLCASPTGGWLVDLLILYCVGALEVDLVGSFFPPVLAYCILILITNDIEQLMMYI